MVAIADEFLEDAGDKGEGFGVVKAHAAGESALGEGAGLGDEELVDLEIMVSRWRFDIGEVDCCCTSFGANCMITRETRRLDFLRAWAALTLEKRLKTLRDGEVSRHLLYACMKYSGVIGSGHITDKEIRNQQSCPLPHFRCKCTIVSF